MELMLESIKKAKVGSMVPIFKESESADPLELFAKISNYGKKKNSLYIQCNKVSIGTADPALVLKGSRNSFEITALSDSGKRFLSMIKKDFSYCDTAKFQKDTLKGTISSPKRNASEDQKLKQKSAIDIIRSVAFSFKQMHEELSQSAGVFGMVAHDFVHTFESVDALEESESNDYVLFFVDNGFMYDTEENKTYLFSHALVTDSKRDKLFDDSNKKVKSLQKAIEKKLAKNKKLAKKSFSIEYDTSRDEFLGVIKEIKKQIVNGEVIQANPSKLVSCTFNAEPLDVFKELQKGNHPYQFYMNEDSGVYIGAQAGLSLQVSSEKNSEVSFNTVSTARPRGYLKDDIDSDLDAKREVRIWADEHELVKHLISVDASRNEIARVCMPGTKSVDEMFVVKKNKESQFLSSKVSGTLKQNLDSLHVLQTTLAFDAGVPKLQAIKLLKKHEKTDRGFYGGSFMCLHPDGMMKTMLLEPIHLKKTTASFRTSSFILHNGSDDNDLQKSDSEEDAIVRVIKGSGGLK